MTVTSPDQRSQAAARAPEPSPQSRRLGSQAQEAPRRVRTRRLAPGARFYPARQAAPGPERRLLPRCAAPGPSAALPRWRRLLLLCGGVGKGRCVALRGGGVAIGCGGSSLDTHPRRAEGGGKQLRYTHPDWLWGVGRREASAETPP